MTNKIVMNSATHPLFDLKHFYEEEWNEHHKVAAATHQALFTAFSQWVDVAAQALQQGRKLLFFGNGGSAADAQHLAAEFSAAAPTESSAYRRAVAASVCWFCVIMVMD